MCYGCDRWVCDVLVFEELCVADSCCPGFQNVDVEALVMLHCCPDVETGIRVNVPGLSILGLTWAITAHPMGVNGHHVAHGHGHTRTLLVQCCSGVRG